MEKIAIFRMEVDEKANGKKKIWLSHHEII